MLSHEKLDVYQRSIEFLAAALRITEKLPRGQAPLAEQFRRAAMHGARRWNVAPSWMWSDCSESFPRLNGIRPRHSSSVSSRCSARCADRLADEYGDEDEDEDEDGDGKVFPDRPFN